jgi:alpha-glucuronidase
MSCWRNRETNAASIVWIWGAILLGCALMAGGGADANALVPGPRQPVDPQAAWLTYSAVDPQRVFPGSNFIPDTIVILGNTPVETTATHELQLGFEGMLHRFLRVANRTSPNLGHHLIVVGTQSEIEKWKPSLKPAKSLAAEGFWLHSAVQASDSVLIVEGADDRGVLYGVYALLRMIAEERSLEALDTVEAPASSVRWTNEWDNPNGSIERGYAGRSIFFDQGAVRADVSAAGRYARLLASVGINGCTINNVNADAGLLRRENVAQIARIAAAFRPYGVRLSLSIAMNSPQLIGGLKTFDPLAPEVIAWWQEKVDEIYKEIPDFAGVIIKADSEGQPGPSQYGRTPAQAANVLARALKPHGGVVLYRGFVYNHHLDWQDPKADRARAGFDNFHNLDGQFDDNVIVLIKHGPIDFQVREPVSPLFAGLHKTNEAIELQITQEYTGQQRHLVFLVPMWKTALDTDMHVPGTEPSRVADIVTGKTFGRSLGGFVGVANVGLEDYWLGNPLAMANLYGFGRLAWNPSLSAATISDEWARLTFGNDPQVQSVINNLQLNSWHIYEQYTGPLGAGTLTDIIGIHYGPGIESSERNGWGQWHRADHDGIGMDRTVATGTGYIGQYPPGLGAQYETLQACPDNLLLFMHHVPYTYKLHSGKTVIQHIYDTHYAGAAAAAEQVTQWESLAGKIPDRTYFEVLRRLNYQAGHALVWRDAVVSWFYKTSGIADEKGRAGHHADRVEAEAMQLDGYSPVEVTPWETASGGKAVVCDRQTCSAGTVLSRPDGWYDIAVQYFDLNNGSSHFELQVNGATIDSWIADDSLPSSKLDGHTSTRHVTSAVALHSGDVLRVVGAPEGKEPAPLDYLEIIPSSLGRAKKGATP